MLVDREVFRLLQIAQALCAPDTDAPWAQDFSFTNSVCLIFLGACFLGSPT